MSAEKVIIGVLINDMIVQQWILKTIDNLSRSEYATVSLIITRNQDTEEGKRKRKYRGINPVRIYEVLDRALFRRSHDYHYPKDLSELSANVAVFNLVDGISGFEPNEKKKEPVNRIKPDVIILFGRHQLEEEIFSIPRYGVWKFSVDTSAEPGELDFGYREVIHHLPLTETVVEQVRGQGYSTDTIYRSRESTYRFSVNINRNKIYYRATMILPRLVEGLARFGEDYLAALKARHTKTVVGDKLPVDSHDSEDWRALWKHLAKLLLLGFNKLIYTDAFSWYLLIDLDNEGTGKLNNFSSYRVIKRPPCKFWADPFIVVSGHKYYLFVEEYIYRKKRAHIAFLELNDEGKYLRSGKVLEMPYHMSYPFTFKIDETYYMIPETSQNRTIELYKCTDFPDKWEFVMNIMEDVTATDTTPFYHENKWWLFTTIDSTNGISGCSTELYLYYSDDIFSGQWISHPLNPVVTDESNARCAGKLYFRDGAIFRPSQDCSVRYGRGININRVTKLNTLEYSEIREFDIRPDWNKKLKGIHTLNSDGNMKVVDVYSFHNRFSLI